MRVMRREVTNGTKEIIKLKDDNGNSVTNSKELLCLVKELYRSSHSGYKY